MPFQPINPSAPAPFVDKVGNPTIPAKSWTNLVAVFINGFLQGTATLAGGTAIVSVPNRMFSTTSQVFLQRTGASSANQLTVSVKTPGTSFTVTSSSGADAGTFDWMVII